MFRGLVASVLVASTLVTACAEDGEEQAAAQICPAGQEALFAFAEVTRAGSDREYRTALDLTLSKLEDVGTAFIGVQPMPDLHEAFTEWENEVEAAELEEDVAGIEEQQGFGPGTSRRPLGAARTAARTFANRCAELGQELDVGF